MYKSCCKTFILTITNKKIANIIASFLVLKVLDI